MSTSNSGSWQFWIDRGGTFTDIVAQAPDGTYQTAKLLSENPEHYADAAIAGIRRLLGIGDDEALPGDRIAAVKMGTTVATNALLERKGARVLLLIDRGLGDLLRIGNQARPRLFDLDIRLPEMLYETVGEIDGRIGSDGREIEPLDEAAARRALLDARADGIEAVAIARMHAWIEPSHERRLAAIARELGFTQVSASHEVSPLLRLVPRGDTTVADAYLSPILRRYVAQVREGLGDVRLEFMQSHGGLADAAQFSGKDAILSGPAGGIVGAVRTAAMMGFERIIGFDMGGTSTDVALYNGSFARVFETEVAGVRMRVPMLAINTVAAGGGSILGFDGARLLVGPESAGADPGPACYRRGGPLTVTDANVLLGKLNPAHFPAIFGTDGNLPLDLERVRAQFAERTSDIAMATGTVRSPEAIAEGYVAIAVARMAHAIRQISIERGIDPSDFALVCFGGAGGQHACLVAEELGIGRILVHPFAGVLSAYGMGLADRAAHRQRSVARLLDEESRADVEAMVAELAAEARAELGAQAAAAEVKASAHLRYEGTDTALPVAFDGIGIMREAFEAAHDRLFGFVDPTRPLIVDMISVEAVAPASIPAEPALATRCGVGPDPVDEVEMYLRGAWRTTRVLDHGTLRDGDVIEGPAMIRSPTTTTLVEPGWRASVNDRGHLTMERDAAAMVAADPVSTTAELAPDPVRLELFSHLFMAIAEQSGTILQQVASSVNIKERLDFSCALFDAQGRLIANAPHVPVHLGAMGESVRAVLRRHGPALRPGDAVALNDPFNGGTHLPDITVVSPVFAPDGRTIRAFLAARGHHADIGGLTPGSAPPFATTLAEEGVVIDNLLVVEQGVFREAALRELLTAGPLPARNPDENIADLKAQIAANEAGIAAFEAMIERHGWPAVERYARHVMDHAEATIRRVIRRLSDGAFAYVMDDGTPLHVRVSIDHAAGSAVIDFTGTGAQDSGNFNAPPSITHAAVLYAFRCLVAEEIPMNEGCLRPISIVIPEGTFLNPAPGAAVVAGNTEVSQAVTAALLGALDAAASGQATMNNLLFGDGEFQYYETICGGAGAGPGFDGCSAVHTHMTNTRITDPEVLELEYPVLLETFAIRRGSGGAGQWIGGDGVTRQIRFLRPMTATVVTSRRTRPPFGLAGGAPGDAGRQRVIRADGTEQAMQPRDRAELAAGDAIVIETPGGGGYGPNRTPDVRDVDSCLKA
jgi:5-oxoprolinase (ATP-hydrolysing)